MAKQGISVSRSIVNKLLKKHKFVKWKMQKKQSTGAHKDRNKQFLSMADLKAQYEAKGNPTLSIDTKKKEKIGNLYRDGRVECVETQVVFDHDFTHLDEGSNACRHHVFKESLQHLSNAINLSIRMANYLP